MTMTHDEAEQLKAHIERTQPGMTCEVRQYDSTWQVIVTNPRTNESFGVVSATDWQNRLNNMQGAEQGY